MPLFEDDRVRLAAWDPDRDVDLFRAWYDDSEWLRLFGSGAARPVARQAAVDDLSQSLKPGWFPFLIRARADDRLLGLVDLDVDTWITGDAWVGIALGQRADWGQGYGTAAMRLVVRYGFEELDLRRITLTVFAYNPRAQRSYEKIGFEVEGRQRAALHKDGQRSDIIVMGLRRSSWERAAGPPNC